MASMDISPTSQIQDLTGKTIHAHGDFHIDSVEDRPRDGEAVTQSSKLVPESSEPSEDAAAQHKAAEMQVWWEESIAKNMGLSDGYQRVAVLLIKWDDGLDELKTRDEVRSWLFERSNQPYANPHQTEELRALFANQFHYHCEVVELNVQSKPQHQLDRHISTFVEQHDGQNNLMIVYYTGHGVFQEHKKYLELTASLNPLDKRGFKLEARANWNKAEESLRSEYIDGDVLTILDTCYSSNLQKSGQEDTRTFELLSACTIDSTTAAPGPQSFTRALIDSLKELLAEYKGLSFTTFHLNQRINLNPKRHDTQSQLWFRLKHHDRHIRLAPLKTATDRDRKPSIVKPPRGYLTLRFALRDDTLNREQIELLTRHLATAFSTTKKMLGIRKIEWLGLKPGRVTDFGRTALAIFYFQKWRKFVTKRHEERESHDLRGSRVDIPAETTAESRSLSPRKRAREVDEPLPEAKKGSIDAPTRQSPPSPPISESSR